MVNDNPSISDAAKVFANSLPREKHRDGQEALRFARWFGDHRKAIEVRPSDLEGYVETFGATDPTSITRADALKSFLAYAHKQGILPERMVSHVRVRRPTARQKAIANSSSSTPEVRLTATGKQELEDELDSLISKRPSIALELREARADGDVRENAPLDAAREAQGQLEARIRELEGTLRHAILVDEDGKPGANDRAHVGCQVELVNVASGVKLAYQLVSAAEARAGTGRLSVESPVGSAVVGKRVGDEFQVTAPSGIVRFRLDKIES